MDTRQMCSIWCLWVALASILLRHKAAAVSQGYNNKQKLANITKKMCSKEVFAKIYPQTPIGRINKAKNITLTVGVDKEDWKMICNHNNSCRKDFHSDLKANIMGKHGSNSLIVTFEAKQQKDCYGYILFLSSTHNGSKRYEETIIHQERNQKIKFGFRFPREATVSAGLIEIPSGRVESLPEFTLPSPCASEVVHYILTNSCDKVTSSGSLALNIGKHLCQEFQTSALSIPMVPERISKYCTEAITSEKYAFLPITGIIGGLIFTLTCLLLACFVAIRKKKATWHSCFRTIKDNHRLEIDSQLVDIPEVAEITKDDTEEEKLIFDRKPTSNSYSTVMILCRPGCELMDSLLRDLAFVLKSYGVRVNLSLLEQTQIDEAGGISSYFQRNIDACDYILVLFSAGNQDQFLSNHKPYDFALKVITGLMYHENNTSRYLMMYIDSFKTAMQYIPTAFLASQNNGFRIPKDITKLVETVCRGPLTEEQHKERQLKNKVFINKIKSTIKKLRNITHEKCHQGKCFKGKAFPSSSNLSSIWATTIHSKFPSVNSLHEKNLSMRDNILEIKNMDIEHNALLRAEEWADSCVSRWS